MIRTLALLATALGFIGCERAYEREIATVKGSVTLDGQPLSQGTVVSTPASGRAARGVIQADGTFQLTTYRTGDGAIVGTHQVTVTATEPARAAPKQSADSIVLAESRSLIPLRYSQPGQSGFVFDVTSGKDHEWKIELSSD